MRAYRRVGDEDKRRGLCGGDEATHVAVESTHSGGAPAPMTTVTNEVPTPAHQWAHATVRGKEPLSRELLANERLVRASVRRARLARAVSPPNGVCVCLCV